MARAPGHGVRAFSPTRRFHMKKKPKYGMSRERLDQIFDELQDLHQEYDDSEEASYDEDFFSHIDRATDALSDALSDFPEDREPCPWCEHYPEDFKGKKLLIHAEQEGGACQTARENSF